MSTQALSWPRHSICLQPGEQDLPAIASDVYERTCRTDFDAPGFCVVNIGSSIGSVAFRQLMVDLKRAIAEIHEARSGHTLVYLSAGRFDQQTTTKPHLDG